MDSDQIARMIYLGILAAAILGSLMVQNRRNLGRLVQTLVLWGLIFLGVAAGFGLWSDISQTSLPRQAVIGPGGTIEVPRARDGHYYVTATVSGTPVRFVVDTGASDVVLTAEDARRVGIDPENLAYIGQARTANGTVATARVRLHDVTLGGVTEPVVGASVNKGQMDTSLLGMSYLQRFSSIEIRGGKMILTR